jgi:hypothetical protein
MGGKCGGGMQGCVVGWRNEPAVDVDVGGAVL